MARTDLLIEYFNKQKEILNLLEESNNIISELFNDQKEDTQKPSQENKLEKVVDEKTEYYNKAVKKDLIREIIMDSFNLAELMSLDSKNDKWYTFRYHDCFGRRKYIQFNKIKYIWNGYNLKKHIVRPTVVTRTGYRAGYNVIFKTRRDAIEFFVKFMGSDARRDINEYDMKAWKIVEVPKRVLVNQQRNCYWDKEYGWFTV